MTFHPDWVQLSASETRDIQLQLLARIGEFCLSHGLQFFLYAGTLLGAIRHQGFIPWDDDIDVMMPRADYEFLLREFPRTGTDYLVDRSVVRDVPFAFAKLCRRGTLVREETRASDSFGVNIDILAVDNVYTSDWKFRCQRLLYHVARALVLAKVLESRKGRSLGKRLLLALTRGIVRPIPIHTLIGARQRVATMSRSGKSMGMLVAEVPWRVDASVMTLGRFLPFEGQQYPVPRGAEVLLTRVYGDFMELPPENERVSHHRAVAYAKRPSGLQD